MTDTRPNDNAPDTPTPDDPNLTAYALGELAPDTDVYNQVEARLASDPDARAYVEQARALADQLSTRFRAADGSAGLLDHQQKEISAMIDQQQPSEPKSSNAPAPRPLRMPRKLLLAAGLALAATAAITTVTLMNGPDKQEITQDDTVEGLVEITNKMGETKVAVDFDNATLSEVFAFLNKQTGVAIDAEWKALEKRGISAETRVSFSDKQLHPAGDVLAYALELAWAQSPHPDPAQWSINDAGITIAPKSALVQARLDATQKLLDGRRFSQTAYKDNLLDAGTAEVWDSDLWNQMLAKRTEAGERVIAEADGALALAEIAAQAEDYDAASEHGLYAYQLLASHGAVLQGDQFNAPLERIVKLEEVIYTGRLAQDRAAIAAAVETAKANDTELGVYESSMLAALEALDNQSFQAANESLVTASTHLNEKRAEYEQEQLREMAGRTVRLHTEVQSVQWQRDAEELAKLEEEHRAIDLTTASKDKKERAEAITKRLADARQLQQQGQYAKAVIQLDAVLEAEPEYAEVAGVREQLSKHSASNHNVRFAREAEEKLSELSAQLGPIENLSRGGSILIKGQDSDAYLAANTRWRTTNGGVGGGAFGGDFSGTTRTVPGRPSRLSLYAETDFASFAKQSHAQPNFAFTPGIQTARPVTGLVIGESLLDGRVTGRRYELGSGGVISGKKAAKPAASRGLALFDDTDPAAAPDESLNWSFEGLRHQDQQWGDRAQLNRPQAEATRRSRYDDLIGNISESIDDDGDGELKEDNRKRIEDLKQTRDRVAATEPLERDRIAAMKELRDLEREFMEGSLPALRPDPELSRDAYATVNDNPFKNPGEQDENGYRAQAISTFSVDVDTAAYSLVRRQLMQQRQLPVPAAIRIEEMINYFDYGYDAPVVDGRALKDGVVTQASLEQFEKDNAGFAPFATHVQVTDCPWQAGNKLVRIGIQGMDVTQEERPAAHLTFLLDVSGSMNNANKLPLVKDSIKLLLDKLNDKDRISIVVYAGRTRTVMENVSATDRPAIEKALDELSSGGSTAGAAGIQLAYDAAQKHFIDGGVNRVILCTDGDFNVGISDTDDLVALIKDKANPKADADGKRRGVYLSVMGYGMGNLNDAMMEPLTNAGNGTYAYIDTIDEAQKVMYDQAGSMLVAIAKDVKVQVHFDPTQVMAYRLIGYENRILATEDFDDDTVDAGDIGAGHSVTALYEVVPFDGDGPFIDGEGIREVKLQIEQLEDAIALNTSLMQTCSLNQGQAMKLSASNKLLAQELELCRAAVQLHDTDADAGKNAEGEEQQKVGEAPAVAEADKDARPRVELDTFEDGAMMSLRLRYKPVDAPAEEGSSRRIDERIFADDAVPFNEADEATRFAASVAGFGMVLRSSPHKGDADLGWVLDTATASLAHDPDQRRAEFIELVGEALTLMPEENAEPEDPGAPK